MAATEKAARAADALDNLYRTHVSEVYRYAYAVLGNHADAEDVTQTTFVNALRALERGESPRKPSNWLITIAHNVVRQRFRTQQARPAEVELDGDVAVEQAADPDGPSLDDLVRALQRIPTSQREALVMRELEGRSYKEIQSILELTPGALETLLFRARRSLAEELENLVTCERAELAMSKRLDGRILRKERRRLDAHVRECPACARLAASHTKHRSAFKALAVLPLPLSLTLFKGVPSASAATGLSTIGVGSMATTGGVSAGTAGGLLAGGVAVKAAAAIAAIAVAGGVGYEGAKQVHQRTTPRQPVVTNAPAGSPSRTNTETHKVARPLQNQASEAGSARSRSGGVPGHTASAPGRADAADQEAMTAPGRSNVDARQAENAAAKEARTSVGAANAPPRAKISAAMAKSRKEVTPAAAKPAGKAKTKKRPVKATNAPKTSPLPAENALAPERTPARVTEPDPSLTAGHPSNAPPDTASPGVGNGQGQAG